MRTLMILTVAALLAGPGIGFAQSGDEAAVRQLAQDFSTAINKGDGKAAAALFTSDGDYVSSTGRSAKGHGEIEKLVAEQAAGAFKGLSFKVTTSSVRFLKPDVAIMDGGFEASGGSRKGLTTSVAVKHGDKWQIAAIRAMVPAAVPKS